jgi:hypothetical protein
LAAHNQAHATLRESTFEMAARVRGGARVGAGSATIPLPTPIWRLLPGREVISETYRLIEQNQPLLPLTMSPTATWLSGLANNDHAGPPQIHERPLPTLS